MHTKHYVAFFFALLLAFSIPFSVVALEGAPIAENMELSTYRGICTDGQLKATDPEGDAITFQLTTPPIKGSVQLEEDGSFVYTPKANKRGKDYFGYTATDANGNVSQEATVIISLKKQAGTVFYQDMAYCGGHYDALRLAEHDIFIGEQIGGCYVFSPDSPVTRGDFLTMCVRLSNTKLLSGVTSTGFSDDASIPTWQKTFVSTALMEGGLRGSNESGNAIFDPLSPITCAQAAVIISDMFSLSHVTAAHFTAEAPSWAQQSVFNLIACDILPENCDTAQTLTRAMTADLLSATMDVLENR